MMNDELRQHEISVFLTQQAVIEMAYGVQLLIEPRIKVPAKLLFEEANCLSHLYDEIRRLLNMVEPEYLKGRHRPVAEFFLNWRDLDTDGERLTWAIPKTLPAYDDLPDPPEGIAPW
jgi:hypothetical protein